MLHFLMLIAAGIIIYNIWVDNTATGRDKKRQKKFDAEHKYKLIHDKEYRDEFHKRVGEGVKRDYPHIGWD